MSEEIKHGFIPVKEIFTNKWYKIPEYQRPYVWGKEQVCDLLADIMNEADMGLGTFYNYFNSKEDILINLLNRFAGVMSEELQQKGLTDAGCCDLEQHAYSVEDRIEDAEIRNMHILSGVHNG